MPRIPQYRRQRLPSTLTGAAPRPREAAYSGQEQFYKGLEELSGAGLGIAGKLNAIDKQKEGAANDLMLSQANRQLSEGDAADTERMNTQNYDTPKAFADDQAGYGERRDARVKTITQDLELDEDTARRLQISSNNSYAASEYRMRGQTASVEKNLAAVSWQRDVVSSHLDMPPQDNPTRPQWEQRRADSRKAHRFYNTEGELDYLEVQALLNASSDPDNQAISQGMIEQADKLIVESENLTAAQKATLKGNSSSAKTTLRAASGSTRERNIWEHASKMPHKEAIKWINSLDIKSSIRNDLIKRRERLSELNGINQNNAAYWSLLREANENPNQNNFEDKVERAVAAGTITTAQGKEILGSRDKADYRLQLYGGQLDALHANGDITNAEWEEYNSKLLGWLKEHRDASPKQVEEYFEDLTGEKKETAIWRMLTIPYRKSVAIKDWYFDKVKALVDKTFGGDEGIIKTKDDEILGEPDTEEEFKRNLNRISGDDKKLIDYYNRYIRKFQ